MRIGRYELTWGRRTYVMGIINTSPDSFAGDAVTSPPAALALGRRLVDEGADLLDVGGASTRPGAPPVDPEEELGRVVPAILALAAVVRVPISVDTTRAAVARAALAAGALIVNDVSGLMADREMASTVAAHGAGIVLMANHRSPLAPAPAGPPDTSDIVQATRARWQASLQVALGAGIAPDRIILDPGLGYGLRPQRSLELLRRLRELRLPDYPLLVGPSRKGFIGHALGGLPVEERLEGSLAAAVLAIAGGADIVRVHDVRATARARLVADAICRPPAP
jgi:dihydropteroate synthase